MKIFPFPPPRKPEILRFLILFVLFVSAPFSWAASPARADGTPDSTPEPPTASPYFSTRTVSAPDGTQLQELTIAGPPQPLPGYEAERQAVPARQLDQPDVSKTLAVPAYEWVYGCSAVSSAMIAGYYDRNGFPQMYTGPANGGISPLNDDVWPIWTDGYDYFPGNPLVASRNGLDGRTTRGSIDDYWVRYGSSSTDPYLVKGWAEHTWGTAIGDYMKTSQSFYGNVDGETSYYTLSSSSGQLTCSMMAYYGIGSSDGTYGRKLFFEARGYTVTDCFNQRTDNQGGGFTYAQYVAEINAGHPVLINLAGHSVTGVGYNTSGSQVYIHDTWDTSLHTMTWGGSYDGMVMQGVSIVHLLASNPPGSFGKSAPASGLDAVSTSPTLSWVSSQGATSYEVCYDTTNDDQCSSWVNKGLSTSTSVSGLSPNTTYYWHVRAINADGTTYSDGSAGADWSFTTAGPPGAFTKSSPSNDAVWQNDSPLLIWTASSAATSYEYCLDTVDNDLCDLTWQIASVDGQMSGPDGQMAKMVELEKETRYYWQVRALNAFGEATADAGVWFSFVTGSADPLRLYLPSIRN